MGLFWGPFWRAKSFVCPHVLRVHFSHRGPQMGLPEALFGTPFWRGIWAQITLTPVWDTNVTMGFWTHIGDPHIGGTPGSGVWAMGPYSLGSGIPGNRGMGICPIPRYRGMGQ